MVMGVKLGQHLAPMNSQGSVFDNSANQFLAKFQPIKKRAIWRQGNLGKFFNTNLYKIECKLDGYQDNFGQ